MKNLTFSKLSLSMTALALLAVFSLAGCGGGGGGGAAASNPSNTSNQDQTSNTNTISGTASLTNGITVLDSATISQIVSSDTSSITFSGSPSTIQSLKPGDIIIVQNIARKVESVSYANGQTVIQTVEPEFSEVFKTLGVSGDVYLAEEHVNKAALPANIKLSVSKAKTDWSIGKQKITKQQDGNVFTYTIEDEVVYDFDGNLDTTNDQVLANGTVVLDKPHIGFDLHYGFLSDKYATLNFKGGEKVNISFSSQKLSFNKTVKIPLGSFEVDIASAITGVPGLTTKALNVTASLTLVFDASGEASIVAGFSQDLSINLGMKASINPVSITSFVNNTSSFTFKQPQIDGVMSASAAINPDLSLNILQWTPAGINNSLGVKTTAKANLVLTDACYRIMADANLSSTAFIMLPKASLDFDFSWDGFSLGYDFKMEKYPKELYSYTKNLYDSGDTCLVENISPIANAGADKRSNVKAAVLLDGTGSYDSDGTIISYAWTQTAGTSVSLSNAYTTTPTFTAPSSTGTLSFRLTVMDNKGATATDDVTVNVLSGETNIKPTADADADQAVNGGTTALLNGSLSLDIDGFIAAYQWLQTGGTQVSLTNANTATPSFTAPSTGSTLTFKLTVTDNKGATATDYVQVVVSAILTGTAPSAPTGASATPDNGQATISWNAVSGATSYNLYWSTSSGVTKTNGTKISNATSPYTHTGRTNGTTYYYVVTAVNSYGESLGSSEVSAKPVGTGTLQGYVKDAVTKSAISNVAVSIYDNTGILKGTVSSDSSGVYSTTLAVGTYSLSITKTGYITDSVSNLTIAENVITTVETVLQIGTQYSGTGNLSGKITNALDGSAVSSATLNFRAGINVTTGTVVATTTTDTYGSYTVSGLNAGNYTGEVVKSGFTTAYFTATVIGGQTNTNQNTTITPILSSGETRIVLTWGSTPSDLDSHLTGPISGSASRFHVYFYNKGDSTYSPYASLDVDEMFSYGPETITIYQQFDGIYRYSVHDYSNNSSSSSTALSNSSAQVKVYRGSNLVATFNVPTNKGGTLWTVFEMSGDTVTPINTMSYGSGGYSVQSPSLSRSYSLTPHSDALLMKNLPAK